MIAPGLQIGPYEIERELGRGGMGVVFAGRDPRLGRPVAIKTVPPELASSESLRSRFEREARTLASINHPNIAAVYGLEEQSGSRYLVMEFVEGQPLADRLARSRLPLPDALSVGAQIASALEAAHDRGIMHRDIKPGNVMIAPDGAVKVLDFGLARESVTVDTTAETVRVAPVTAEGIVVGTPGYMSPEQARGKSLDRRTDIFSFGCVLYECLTGEPSFGGESVSDRVAAVLEREPSWDKLPANTPARIRDLLRRCLEKDARKRLRDIGDARLDLEEAVVTRAWSTTSMLAAAGPARRPRWVWAAAALALAAGAGAGVWAIRSARAGSPALSGGPAAAVTRLVIPIPADVKASDQFTVAPDGHSIAYIATPKGGRPQIYTRALDSFEATPVQGTEGAYYVAYSPDSHWLAFTSRASETTSFTVLKKVPVAGGAPIKLCEQSGGVLRLPAWVGQDRIVLLTGSESRQISIVPSDGGEPRLVWDVVKHGFSERPQSLIPVPGGKYLLFTQPVSDAKGWRERAMVLALDTGQERLLLDYGAYPVYLAPGYLAFTQGTSLLIRPFDPARAEFTGGAVPLVSGLRAGQSYCAYMWDCSQNGVLAYVAGGALSSRRHISLFDLQGKAEPLSKLTSDFEDSVAMSPDGRLVAGAVISESGSYELFIYDIAQDGLRRFAGRGDCVTPTWSPDSQHIAYGLHSMNDSGAVLLRRADGADVPQVLWTGSDPAEFARPTAFSPDGKWVICDHYKRSQGDVEMMALSVAEPHETKVLCRRSGHQLCGAISPDGAYIAYKVDEGGRQEVLIEHNPLAGPAPAGQSPLVLASASPYQILWAPDGASILLIQGRGQISQIDIKTQPALSFSTPKNLGTLESIESAADNVGITPDGKHLVVIQKSEEEASIRQLNVVLNWNQEIKAKFAAGPETKE